MKPHLRYQNTNSSKIFILFYAERSIKCLNHKPGMIVTLSLSVVFYNQSITVRSTYLNFSLRTDMNDILKLWEEHQTTNVSI